MILHSKNKKRRKHNIKTISLTINIILPKKKQKKRDNFCKLFTVFLNLISCRILLPHQKELEEELKEELKEELEEGLEGKKLEEKSRSNLHSLLI
jgi:hypothetical protein